MDTIVIPANSIAELEEKGLREKCGVVGIDEISVTYVQPADTNSSQDEVQFLTVTTQLAVPVTEGEEGFYFNISIPEGQHWSMDDGESLKAIIDDFKKMLYMTTDSRKDGKSKNTGGNQQNQG
jgi:hypothetical protein